MRHLLLIALVAIMTARPPYAWADEQDILARGVEIDKRVAEMLEQCFAYDLPAEECKVYSEFRRALWKAVAAAHEEEKKKRKQ